ncbi:hypothetical protein BBJ29_008463 [Phytophthora kernoviae]|uniref:DUF676 domain-containing protein n=1 Tax=Phytophthora kernoviae TaxID=325452 RepID=A0A3R7IRU3_9STRA|nr:hypothetical protein BBJ29_008463 [Phytophthora kernoviae]
MRSPRPVDDPEKLASATHLAVFQHGLLGSKRDFGRFVEIFRSQFHVDSLYLHSGESNDNSFFQTYDGVDQGGERLADEILQLAEKMPNLRKLSMIGHSLGGLYNRYCIGVLLARGFFDKIEPVNFVTLATPHLGIRRSHRHATNVVFNALMTKIFSRTGQQLTLTDSANEMTQKLSTTSDVSLGKEFYPGTVYSQSGYSTDEAAKGKAKVEIDLTHADVKVLLPPLTQENAGDLYASFIGWGQRNSGEENTEASENFDIQIRWPVEVTSAYTGKPADTNLCVIRIPEEDIQRDWRWLVALSNASFGMHCLTSAGNGKAQQPQNSTAPTLLSCMTRGQFMQALQMFKVRTLYANMFFDMQVPYSCAAVRAFNPYRQSMKESLMSPIYTHIVFDSLKNAQPFVDGDVILDQLPYAFTSDAEQDELRGMLLSVQSVGWRRIDVLFGSVMAHEHIIAKRAKLDKPLDSGIDIVHHVMDTFLL